MKAHPIHFHPNAPTLPRRAVEGFARVVGIAGERLWLEPEQTTSCGHCASSASCGSAESGMGTVAGRLVARRFGIERPSGSFAVGDRVVIGVGQRALLRAALTAYGLPLFAALLSAAVAQAACGSDALTLAGMLGGLIGGMGLARITARFLVARGELAPRFLRRAAPGETCGTATLEDMP